ncbi:MAG: heme lyase CcmF/NrfE family subunit, partial [Pseudomonadota bacterium]
MTAELGHLAVVLAFMVALVQMIVPMIGARAGWSNWMAVAAPAAVVQAMLLLVSFGALTWAFVTSDFSLALVTANSHSAKPLIYKISGTWGNHEGSLLLWILILALFGAAVALLGRGLPDRLRALVLAVQSSIAVAFMLFLLLTSNPFVRHAFPPFDGNDLNPLLQDPGLAFHPPFLYLGYVGLSMAFSFAIAALIEGKVDAAWARWVRPWTLAAWVFLTIGIGLGSWWAYYELGWGGWWFWDPVENASFMPWLIAAALLHSAIVVEKRNTLKSWTILLAILGFSFSLIGTFIVRSGVITSVHAFANDPTRGVFILGILAVFIGGALTLFAARAHVLRSDSVFALSSRESALVMNNLLLVVATFVVLVGTLWPLFAEMATGRKVSVGPPYFNMAFTPFFVLLGMLLPLGAMLPWKRAQIGKTMHQLWGALALSIALGALVWSLQTGGSILTPLGALLGAWIILGSVADLAQRARVGKAGWGEVLRRLTNLPRADWGKAVAHTGLGVLFFSIAALEAGTIEDIRVVQPGERYEFAGYTLQLDQVRALQGPNYQAERATVQVFEGGVPETVISPEKRFYPVQSFPTTEAGIWRTWGG